MIRKAIIVVLTLCALLVLLLGWDERNHISMLDNGFGFAGWGLNIGWAASPSPGVSRNWAFGGFQYDFWATGGVSYVRIPLWFLAGLFAAYPTIAFVRGPLRRRRRRRKGLCLKCGYNLTGLPEPRCPECATEFDPSTCRPESAADA